MKILFVKSTAFDINKGGVQRTTYKMGSYFHSIGYEVFYFSLKNSGHQHKYPGHQFNAIEPNGASNKENIAKLKALIEKISPKIIINQMPYIKSLSKVLSDYSRKNTDVRLIGCLRNTLFSFKDNIKNTTKRILPASVFKIINNKIGFSLILAYHYFKHRSQLRTILKRHDYFVLLTPANKKELEFFVGDFLSNKIAIIPNSIPNIEQCEALKENTLLFVGKISEDHKRADLLLPIWRLLVNRLPDWKFEILGDGSLKERITKEISLENLKNIKLLGSQQPEPHYRKAKLLLMTSEKEGFPNVILEAQSYGVIPFLFNSYMAVQDIIKNGENGFHYPAFDINKMVDGIEKIAKNDNLRKCISIKCLDSAQDFTLDNVGRKWVNFFNQIA